MTNRHIPASTPWASPPRRRGFRPTLRHLLVASLVAGLSTAASVTAAVTADVAAAVTAADPPAPSFSEEIDVRVVNVEVVVTRDGEPVHGLGADDFLLEVDGRRVPIEYFSEVRGGLATDKSTSRRVAAAGRPVGTRFLVFVDDAFSIGARRNGVLRRLGRQLDAMGPRDTMALVAWDGERVDLLSSWTRDTEELERALDRAMARESYGLLRRSEWARIESVQGFRGRAFGGSSFSSIGFHGSRRDPSLSDGLGARMTGRVGQLAAAASAALRAFAAPDGRKVMLLLSGGVPEVAGREIDAISWPDERWRQLRDVRRLLTPLVDTANLLGYTVYPVDLGSTYDAGMPDASDATLTQALMRGAAARDGELFADEALQFVADETGGEAYLDAGRFQALRRAVEDTRSYYGLGFIPELRGDDRIHEIEVTVPGAAGRGAAGPDVRVRSRESYSDLSRVALATMRVESAHLFDLPLDLPPGMAVDVGTPRPSSQRRRMEVPVRVVLPLDRFTLLPTAEGWRGRAEIRFAATDERGASAPVPVIEVELRSASEPSAGDVQVHEAILVLRDRSHRLLVTALDPPSGALYGRRCEVDPP